MRSPRSLFIGLMLLGACRTPGPKFRFSPLPDHYHAQEASSTPAAHVRPAPRADPTLIRPDTAAPEERAFVPSQPPNLSPATPDSTLVRTPTPVTAQAPPPNQPGASPARPVRLRGPLLVAAVGLGGAALLGASLVALPALLTAGVALSALFLVGGAAVLLVRTIGRQLRKKRRDKAGF